MVVLNGLLSHSVRYEGAERLRLSVNAPIIFSSHPGLSAGVSGGTALTGHKKISPAIERQSRSLTGETVDIIRELSYSIFTRFCKLNLPVFLDHIYPQSQCQIFYSGYKEVRAEFFMIALL